MDVSHNWLPRRFALVTLAAVFAVVGPAVLSTACGAPNDAATIANDSTDPADAAADASVPSAAEPDAAAASAPCTPPAAAPASANDCTAPIAPGTDRKCTIDVGGTQREVLVYAPPSYDACKPAALVVDAHGSSETDAEQAGLSPFLDWPGGLGSGWRLVADREGFLVAQPQGLQNAWTESDADFMLKIPAFVAKTAKVDSKRVYLTGISNGGELTYWTGCRDTDVFRAFAPVSGFGKEACPLAHHAPLIHFHSPDDKIVPLADGQAAFQMWVASNHCKRGPSPASTFGGASSDPRAVCLEAGSAASPKWKLAACGAAVPPTTCETWDQCDQGAEATFCTVSPDKQNHYDTTGGHILYINGTKLSLAAVAWEYFKRFQ